MALSKLQANSALCLFAQSITYQRDDGKIVKNIQEFAEVFGKDIHDWKAKLRGFINEQKDCEHVLKVYDFYCKDQEYSGGK